jgi:hypothetical protein
MKMTSKMINKTRKIKPEILKAQKSKKKEKRKKNNKGK